MTKSTRHDETMPRLADPKPGDRYHEMLSAWMGVVWVGDGVIVEHCWGQNPPESRGYKYHPSIPEFVRQSSYGRIPGSPWTYLDAKWKLPLLTDVEARGVIAGLEATPEDKRWLAIAAGL